MTFEIPQVTYDQNMPGAYAGMRATTRNDQCLSRRISVACEPGLLMVGDESDAHPPTTAQEVALHSLGVLRYESSKQPTNPRFSANDYGSLQTQGDIWVTLLSGAAPVSGDPVYAYRGATTANRGKFTEDGTATSVSKVPGAKFTGRLVGSDMAEISLNQPETVQAGSLLLLSDTFTFADLTDADTAQTLNIGDPLPAGARIISREVVRTTAFAGGAVSDLKLEIGTVADPDAIMTALDVDTGTGTSLQGTAGVNPNGSFGGTQLVATFTSTGGNVTDTTAGEVTINIQYQVA